MCSELRSDPDDGERTEARSADMNPSLSGNTIAVPNDRYSIVSGHSA